MLQIININSKIGISDKQISFIEDKIRRVNRLEGPKGNGEGVFSYESIAEHCPVFLIDESGLPPMEYNTESMPATELLGYYKRILVEGHSIPAVFICIDRIKKITSEDTFDIILAKVLFHEFAHARMDDGQYASIDEFYQWMEEPFANYLVLEFFSEEEQKIVRDFIKKQPPNYKLALDFENHRFFYWWIWRSHKEDIFPLNNEKVAWLDYVKNNVGKIKEKKLKELFDDLTK